MKSILEKMTHHEKINYLNSKLSNWILSIADKYRSDYPHLQQNWEMLCKKYGVQPQKILLVSNIPYPKENMEDPIHEYCSILTQLGYVVRRANEFIFCKDTDEVFPVEELHNYMKKIPQLMSKIPDQYSIKLEKSYSNNK